MPKMYADLFSQLLTFVEFAVKPPKFGKVDAKSVTLMKTSQVRVQSQRAQMNAKAKFYLVFVATQCGQQIGFPKKPSGHTFSAFAFAQCK